MLTWCATEKLEFTWFLSREVTYDHCERHRSLSEVFGDIAVWKEDVRNQCPRCVAYVTVLVMADGCHWSNKGKGFNASPCITICTAIPPFAWAIDWIKNSPKLSVVGSKSTTDWCKGAASKDVSGCNRFPFKEHQLLSWNTKSIRLSHELLFSQWLW